mgnify:CR=1 FL=1
MEGLDRHPRTARRSSASCNRPLKTPGISSGSAKSVALARIVDREPGDQGRQGIPVSRVANPAETKVAVSEITALSDTEFLVDERDGELQPRWRARKIYVADMSDATDVGPNATVPGGV